jgi:hypothetical protein
MRAIIIEQFGGPERLVIHDADHGCPCIYWQSTLTAKPLTKTAPTPVVEIAAAMKES